MPYVDSSKVADLPLPFMSDDHAEEFRLLEHLGEALGANGAPPALDAVLERLAVLAVHTREHFLREEAAMRTAGFSGYASHKAEHDRLLAEMDVQARRFRERGDAATLRRYLFDVVPGWYLHHTNTMDLAAARFVAERRA
jgi:hemerythrin